MRTNESEYKRLEDTIEKLKAENSELMKKLSNTLTELGIAFSFPIEIKDTNGNETYYEDSTGYWQKREYDSNGNETSHEDSTGYWRKREYDSNGNETYFENSDGYWCKWEYDSKGNKTYYEDSKGYWERREYDAKGNKTYCENNHGLKPYIKHLWK